MQTTESEWDPKEAADLGEELLKYADTLELEKGTKKKIAEYVHDVEKALSKQVELNPKRLSEWFPDSESAVLVDGERLILKRGGKEIKLSMLELEPAPYMAVVNEVASQVTKLMDEEDAKRAKSVLPTLQVFIRSSGRSVPSAWNTSELVFSNMGGRASQVMVMVPSSKEWYGPFDINAMETAEVGLHNFLRVKDTGVLKITVRCKDEDGRNYSGGTELTLGSKAVRILKLAPADPAK